MEDLLFLIYHVQKLNQDIHKTLIYSYKMKSLLSPETCQIFLNNLSWYIFFLEKWHKIEIHLPCKLKLIKHKFKIISRLAKYICALLHFMFVTMLICNADI